MGTPAEDAKAKLAQEKAAQLAVIEKEAEASLAQAYTGIRLSEVQKQKIHDRLVQIYDARANTKVNAADVKNVLDGVINNTMGDPTSVGVDEIDKRIALLTRTTTVANNVFHKREDLTNPIDTLLNAVGEKASPEFAYAKDSKKLEVMAALQHNTARILNATYVDTDEKTADELKKETLEASIKQTLTAATGGKLKNDVQATAETLATDILARDAALRTEMAKFLDDNGITGGKNEEVKKRIAEAKGDTEILAVIDVEEKVRRDGIIASVSERVWPEMMRQDVPNGKKVDYVKAVIADSIRGEGTLTAEQQKKIDAAASRLSAVANFDPYKSENGQIPANHQFIVDAVKRSTGSGWSLAGVNVGTGAAIGTGVGAALGLAVGDTQTTWGMIKGLGAAAIGAGIGVAYDNGAFDSLLKPNAPTLAKTDAKNNSGASKT